ncbi:MAG: class I SAM-dependent methyltransferase [Nitrososphaerales archaeon]|nr:class I SAM-dependent methyltransferase [Nitrososphaerales archaeon]
METENRKVWQDPEEILNSVGTKPDFIAADLGCGSGFFTVPLSQRVRRVYAIDIQKEMLDFLKEKVERLKIKNVELLLSKEDEIPLEDESLDLLISINTLHEFGNKKRMIEEINRVLKYNGDALIVDFKKEDTGFGPPVAIRVSKDGAIDFFEKKGFVTLQVRMLSYHYLLVFKKKKV